MKGTRVPGCFVCAALLLLRASVVVGTEPPMDQHLALVRSVFEDEVWRIGGPRQDRVVELFSRAVDAGDALVTLEAEYSITEMVDRGWIDPTAFRPLIDRLRLMPIPSKYGMFDLVEPLVQELRLQDLGSRGREELLRRVIESGAGGEEYGLDWQTAASLALRCHVDQLVPAIERALATRTAGPGEKTSVASLREVDLPLARARLSSDWVRGYMALAREAAVAQERYRDLAVAIEPSRVARDALLELVHKGRKEVTPELEKLWRNLAVSQEVRRRWIAQQGLVDRGVLDSEPPRTGLLAEWLVRAIRALGNPSFQEKNLRLSGPTPGQAEEVLVRDRLLSPARSRD